MLALLPASGIASAVDSDRIFQSGFEFPNPFPGEFVITEILVDSVAVPDAQGEWFEIVNTNASQIRNLVGCQVTNGGASSNTLPSYDVQPQARIVFAHTTNQVTNGGVQADLTFTFALVNTTGTLTFECNGQVLDAISWTTSMAGHSRSLDPDLTTVEQNDSDAAWCFSTTPYGSGDFGTPAQQNAQCP